MFAVTVQFVVLILPMGFFCAIMADNCDVLSFETNTTKSHIITLMTSLIDFSSTYVPKKKEKPYIAEHRLKVSETIYVLNCLSRLGSQSKSL